MSPYELLDPLHYDHVQFFRTLLSSHGVGPSGMEVTNGDMTLFIASDRASVTKAIRDELPQPRPPISVAGLKSFDKAGQQQQQQQRQREHQQEQHTITAHYPNYGDGGIDDGDLTALDETPIKNNTPPLSDSDQPCPPRPSLLPSLPNRDRGQDPNVVLEEGEECTSGAILTEDDAIQAEPDDDKEIDDQDHTQQDRTTTPMEVEADESSMVRSSIEETGEQEGELPEVEQPQEQRLEIKSTNRIRQKLNQRKKKKILKDSAEAKARFDKRRADARLLDLALQRADPGHYNNDDDDDDDNDDNGNGNGNDIEAYADNEATPAPEPRFSGDGRSPTIEINRRTSSIGRLEPPPGSGPLQHHTLRSSEGPYNSNNPPPLLPPIADRDRVWLSARLLASKKANIRATSPTMQDRMIQTASSVGGIQSMQDWQDIYQHWRDNGDLNTTTFDSSEPLAHFVDPPETMIERNPHLKTLKPVFWELHLAWNKVKRVLINDLLGAICYRQKLAALSEVFQKAARAIVIDFDPAKKSSVKQARITLFCLLHPGYKDITDPDKNSASIYHWGQFTLALRKGKTWSSIALRLGYGVFALIPESLIHNKFIEQELRVEHLDIWLDLVERVNPDCVSLSNRFADIVNCALLGQRIQRKRLRLEIVPRADIQHTTDLSTLLQEVDEGQLTSGDECNNPTQPGWDLILD